MRRVAILVALVALDVWLIGGSARPGRSVLPGLASAVSAQSGCCPPGTGTFPHWGCDYDGQCVPLNECGFDDCSACEECDPEEEDYCLDIGWEWDPESCECYPPECDPAERNECLDAGGTWNNINCTCTYPNCDPVARQQCIAAGGTWNDTTCTCTYPECDPIARQQCIAEGCTWDEHTCSCTCAQACNPGQPVYVGSQTDSSYWCLDCNIAEICTTIIDYYVQYCEDGSIYDRWGEVVYDGCSYQQDWDCGDICLFL